jgi:hypothetical protein
LPVLAQDAAPAEIPLLLTEWALEPAQISIPAGQPERFAVVNGGAIAHALAIEGAGLYVETDAIGSSQTAYLDLQLDAPGVYQLYCPIAFGQHRLLGQDGLLLVLGPEETADPLHAASPRAAAAPSGQALSPERTDGPPDALPPDEPADPPVPAFAPQALADAGTGPT